MKKRILAGLTASVLAAACAAQIPSILSVSAAGSYDMQLKIQLDGEKKAISPYIYGVNESGNSGSLKSVKTNAVRQGGNRFSDQINANRVTRSLPCAAEMQTVMISSRMLRRAVRR